MDDGEEVPKTGERCEEQITLAYYPIVSLCVTKWSQVTAWWKVGSINGFGLFFWLTSYSSPFLLTCGRFLRGKGWISCSKNVSKLTTWPSSSQIILIGTQVMRQLVSSYVKFLLWVHLHVCSCLTCFIIHTINSIQ